MTIAELQERLDNANEKVNKCQLTLQKRITKVEKTKAAFEHDPSRENDFNYSIAQEDYKTTTNKLKDLQFTVNTWTERLNKEKAKQNFISDIPEILKQFCENWKQSAIEWYNNKYENYIKTSSQLKQTERKIRIDIINNQSEFAKYRKLNYDDFDLINPYYLWRKYEKIIEENNAMKELNKSLVFITDIIIINMTREHDEEDRQKYLEKEMEVEKQNKLIDLMQRIIDITGTLTDCNGLSISPKGGIDGIVKGEKGSAKIETISAGGYNIQCYHFRTLVHEI